jgi:hypothetical protein
MSDFDDMLKQKELYDRLQQCTDPEQMKAIFRQAIPLLEARLKSTHPGDPNHEKMVRLLMLMKRGAR